MPNFSNPSPPGETTECFRHQGGACIREIWIVHHFLNSSAYIWVSKKSEAIKNEILGHLSEN
jgi:hypothetical protein